MSERRLLIEGARQNNLKNLHLSLPHNKVISVTGVSGSGKSSLAFETIFAEGQWRFIESLSTYARLFLEKLDRPEVDAIHNIRPAIALEQRNPVRGSRSTVGTLTETYDLFRLLYAKVSVPFCPACGKEIRKWDPSQVMCELLEHHAGKKALIMFETKALPEELKKKGFSRFWQEGQMIDMLDPGTQFPDGPLLHVVLDRLVIKDDRRMADSIEMAWREGNGRIALAIVNPGEGPEFEIHRFFSGNTCEECDIELPAPYPLFFSFNHPVGACPECKGFGNILRYDEDLIIPDKSISLARGAVDPWEKPAYRWWKKQCVTHAGGAGIDTKKPYTELTAQERTLLFKGGPGFYGINDFFDEMETRRYKLHIRVFLSRYRKPVTCTQCGGKRLRQEALAYKIGGLDIADLCSLQVSDIHRFFEDVVLSPFQRDTAKELLRQIYLKLRFLERVGLAYLGLNRDGKTLSGGEFQRVNLANQLASFLTGTLYVLDEPTVGLHAKDTELISEILSELAGLGNTVLVVEHDQAIIRSSDWVVELGPGGGQYGGDVVFSGPMDAFKETDTLTARYIRGEYSLSLCAPQDTRKRMMTGDRYLRLLGATGHNLRSVDLDVPLGSFTAVTGVSGSGKSSLVVETLYRALTRELKTEFGYPLPFSGIEGAGNIKAVKLISQSPIGRSPRSNPVTYLKIFDLIRKLFAEQTEAKAFGYGSGFFSFNISGGRCEACKGAGYQKVEMYFFEDLYIKCEECSGRRYTPEALRVPFRGKNIYEVLCMTVDDAVTFFHDMPKILNKLLFMRDIGLGYLRLGQPATTLSGGEAQRLKICAEMVLGNVSLEDAYTGARGRHKGKKGNLYVLDEPTIGLHIEDVKALMHVLTRLVSAGNTVIVIEHNLDVIRACDWIIDLGPGGGDKGGQIIFEGTPEDIMHDTRSHTGSCLKHYVEMHSPVKSTSL
jgi:excinuclease ABC subunit A